MIRRSLIVLLAILALSYVSLCQETNRQQDTLTLRYGKPVPVPVILDTLKHIWRPPLSLQNALRIAEAYLEKEHEVALKREHIDLRRYFLGSAKLGRYGSENSSNLVWYFFWHHEEVDHLSGITIIVSMEGEPYWVPEI